MARNAMLMLLPLLVLVPVKFVECTDTSYSIAKSLSARVTESIKSPPRWKRTNRAEDDTVIHLQIGLKHSGFDELERRLYEGKFRKPSPIKDSVYMSTLYAKMNILKMLSLHSI